MASDAALEKAKELLADRQIAWRPEWKGVEDAVSCPSVPPEAAWEVVLALKEPGLLSSFAGRKDPEA